MVDSENASRRVMVLYTPGFVRAVTKTSNCAPFALLKLFGIQAARTDRNYVRVDVYLTPNGHPVGNVTCRSHGQVFEPSFSGSRSKHKRLIEPADTVLRCHRQALVEGLKERDWVAYGQGHRHSSRDERILTKWPFSSSLAGKDRRCLLYTSPSPRD